MVKVLAEIDAILLSILQYYQVEGQCAMVKCMDSPRTAALRKRWECISCRAPLEDAADSLHCAACGKAYPVVCGIPLLVSDPMRFLRSELAALNLATRDSAARLDVLGEHGEDAGLTAAARERHRDVLVAEVARAQTFLKLLEPAATFVRSHDESEGTQTAWRTGWSFDSLFPYLLRDWTETSELAASSSVINRCLREAFPEPADKAVVVAGCGAGGFLAEIADDFATVQGFDLAFPVLAAARHLLDDKSLRIPMPKCICSPGEITLRKPDRIRTVTPIELIAMDTFNTAFANESVDCVITSFLLDLIPQPQRLAVEIHRILTDGGLWINYGPSGPLNALWRFGEAECAAFFSAAGFDVTKTERNRATYLDLSRDCPAWSFRNHMCYLTAGRKARARYPWIDGGNAGKVMPASADIPRLVPEHFPGATLVYRQSLGPEPQATIAIRHERLPGDAETVGISNDAVRIVTLVDGKRTTGQIAEILKADAPARPVEATFSAFAEYFKLGLLSWRDPGR